VVGAPPSAAGNPNRSRARPVTRLERVGRACRRPEDFDSATEGVERRRIEPSLFDEPDARGHGARVDSDPRGATCRGATTVLEGGSPAV